MVKLTDRLSKGGDGNRRRVRVEGCRCRRQGENRRRRWRRRRARLVARRAGRECHQDSWPSAMASHAPPSVAS